MMDPRINLPQPVLENLARWIAQDLQPASVLHVGCQGGQLVAQLRKLGVQAWGIESAELSPPVFTPEAASFCRLGSLTTPFEQQFDLVVCLELVPQLPAADANTLIRNICQHAQTVLFSATPFYQEGLVLDSVQSPGFWSAIFSRFSFYHDLELSCFEDIPWAIVFRRKEESLDHLISDYEECLWRYSWENQARRGLGIEQNSELATQSYLHRVQVERLEATNAYLQSELDNIVQSMSWRLIQYAQRWRLRLAPLGSRRERWMRALILTLFDLRRYGLRVMFSRGWERVKWRFKILLHYRRRVPRALQGELIHIDPIRIEPPARHHETMVDIVVCVHNALADVKNCLDSVVQKTEAPYTLILVDDGSDAETRDYLAAFSAASGCKLIRNEQARGYTCAANQGLQQSSADFVVLLNSDTIVTAGWVDRMVACAQSDPQIGIVGPLSNTASWQSIPELEENGDWATNPLPPDISIENMGEIVARYSGRIYPEMKFLNGFCLMIRKTLIDEIGLFDEETFGAGYGEEDDYTLRARKAGWKLALADDVYIYHAQSKSYSHEKRKNLSQQAGRKLAKKHGQKIIDEGVQDCLNNRVLLGIRAHSQSLYSRSRAIDDGRKVFEGKRLLFVLPIATAGGGGNVIFSEARAMCRMGVDVQIFNLNQLRSRFWDNHPNLDLPVIFGEISEIPSLARQFDAVVATMNTSVAWLEPVSQFSQQPVLGYYIQGFEPLMYSEGSPEYQQALRSYTLVPHMVRFTKTDWTRRQVLQNAGADSIVVGPSVDVDLLRPRSRIMDDNKKPPIRIGAMVREGSPYRSPKLTMGVLQDVSMRFGPHVEILTFGLQPGSTELQQLPTEFAWKMAGQLSTRQVARFVNELDIFVDFSSHQAMGLTAMEAMACGAAVIVPSNGGAVEFATHNENALVVDTSSYQECLSSLVRLIEDQPLRGKIQRNALFSIHRFFPERSALEILKALFPSVTPS